MHALALKEFQVQRPALAIAVKLIGHARLDHTQDADQSLLDAVPRGDSQSDLFFVGPGRGRSPKAGLGLSAVSNGRSEIPNVGVGLNPPTNVNRTPKHCLPPFQKSDKRDANGVGVFFDWKRAMAKQEYTNYQRGIISRYYNNLDVISLAKLQELVGELYLADTDKKRDRLWQRVQQALARLNIPPAIADHIMAQKNAEVLAKNLQEWLANSRKENR